MSPVEKAYEKSKLHNKLGQVVHEKLLADERSYQLDRQITALHEAIRKLEREERKGDNGKSN